MTQSNPKSGKSSLVSTNQHGPHLKLGETVLGHYEHAWREPLHQPSASAFNAFRGLLDHGEGQCLVLDSGCGTGASTVALAKLHPGKIVVGIDRSAARLRRIPTGSLAVRAGNCIWIRARLETFWRLLYGMNWQVEKNYLLYPNPWPKAEQMKKRWHAHPVFPIVLALSRSIELRTNWRLYAEEFALAMDVSGWTQPRVERYIPVEPVSPFEKKYAASRHDLYRVNTNIPA